MEDIPLILYKVALKPHHKPTMYLRHSIGAIELPVPAQLKVLRFPGSDEVYLLYCKNDEHEQTDTLHESVEDAMESARRQFGVQPGEWTIANEKY